MTVVFRSCLPRFNSDTNPSLSNDDHSEDDQSELRSSSTQWTSVPTNQAKGKRGARYTRIDDTPQPLLTRVLGTIFGDYGSVKKRKKRRSKKTLVATKSRMEKHFQDNQRTLNSFATLLTRIETSHHPSHGEHQARNNNRIDDASSNASSPYSCQSTRKMIDNQQQTQLYSTKITTGTSTQLNDSSWFDIIGEDPTTNDAWTRIRRRLKPQEQKDILRALMIICANLFDVSLENKQL